MSSELRTDKPGRTAPLCLMQLPTGSSNRRFLREKLIYPPIVTADPSSNFFLSRPTKLQCEVHAKVRVLHQHEECQCAQIHDAEQAKMDAKQTTSHSPWMDALLSDNFLGDHRDHPFAHV